MLVTSRSTLARGTKFEKVLFARASQPARVKWASARARVACQSNVKRARQSYQISTIDLRQEQAPKNTSALLKKRQTSRRPEDRDKRARQQGASEGRCAKEASRFVGFARAPARSGSYQLALLTSRELTLEAQQNDAHTRPRTTSQSVNQLEARASGRRANLLFTNPACH